MRYELVARKTQWFDGTKIERGTVLTVESLYIANRMIKTGMAELRVAATTAPRRAKARQKAKA